MFVSNERVPVSVDGGTNTIYIRAKMSYGVKQRVEGAAARVSLGAVRSGGIESVPLDIAAWNVALLVHNVLGWDGPGFRDASGDLVPCDATHIQALDPDEPLVDAVLAEIQRRNLRREAADPNGRGAPTSAGAPS